MIPVRLLFGQLQGCAAPAIMAMVCPGIAPTTEGNGLDGDSNCTIGQAVGLVVMSRVRR